MSAFPARRFEGPETAKEEPQGIEAAKPKKKLRLVKLEESPAALEAPAPAEIELAPVTDLKTATHVAEREMLPSNADDVIVDLTDKQRQWLRELTELRSLGVLDQEQTKRAELLEQRVKKADAIQDRIYALKKRDAARKEADKAAATIAENEQAIKELEETKQAELNEAAKAAEAVASQQSRLAGLKTVQEVSLGNLPSDQLQQLAELPKTIASLEVERERRTRIATSLDEDIGELQTRIQTAESARDTALERAREAATRTAELTLALVAMEAIPIEEPKVEPEAKVSPEAKPTALEQPRVAVKPIEAEAEEVKKKTRGGAGKAAATVFVAGMAGIAAGVAAVGRVVETFFSRLYSLTMNPRKFFSDLKREFSRRTAEVPEGKGKIRGSLSALGWLFAGERLSKKKPEESGALAAYQAASKQPLSAENGSQERGAKERKEDPLLSSLSWIPRELAEELEYEEDIRTLGELKKAYHDPETKEDIKELIKKYAKDKAKDVEAKLKEKRN